MTHGAQAQPPTPTSLVGSMWSADDIGQAARAVVDGVGAMSGVLGARVCIVGADGLAETSVASDPCPVVGAGRRRRAQRLRGDTSERVDMPLLDRAGGVVGTLSVYNRIGAGLDEETVAQVIEVARQAGLAIEHLRLAERLQRAHRQLAAQRAKLSMAEQTWRIAFQEAPIGMSMLALDRHPGRFLQVNQALCQLSGYSVTQLTSKSVVELTHPGDRPPITAALQRAAQGRRTPSTLYLRFLHRSGLSLPVRLTSSPVFTEDRAPHYAIGHIEDLSGQVRPDTGLVTDNPFVDPPSRSALTHIVDHTMQRAHRTATTAGVMLCDLRDIQAHAAQLNPSQAAEYNADLARHLRRALRPEDVLGRLDDTTLAVVLEELTEADAKAIARRVRAALSGATHGTGAQCGIDIGIGIGMIKSDTGDAHAVLSAASGALRLSRSTGYGTQVAYPLQPTPRPLNTNVTLWHRPEP